MNHRSKSFKALQKVWEKKLSDSGLENIEQPDGNLKLWTSSFFKVRYNATLFEAKEEYYRMASQFLHDHRFEADAHKKMWELHANGVSMRNIACTLRKKGIATNKDLVNAVIQDLAKVMLGSTRAR